MQGNTENNPNKKNLHRVTNRIKTWDPRPALGAVFADAVTSAAHGRVAVLASGHAAARRSAGSWHAICHADEERSRAR